MKAVVYSAPRSFAIVDVPLPDPGPGEVRVRKGTIQPGSDADLAFWDRSAGRRISLADLHHDGDYSPWEGWEVGVCRSARFCGAA